MGGQPPTLQLASSLSTPTLDPADPRAPWNRGNSAVQMPPLPDPSPAQIQQQLQAFHFDANQSATDATASRNMPPTNAFNLGGVQQPPPIIPMPPAPGDIAAPRNMPQTGQSNVGNTQSQPQQGWGNLSGPNPPGPVPYRATSQPSAPLLPPNPQQPQQLNIGGTGNPSFPFPQPSANPSGNATQLDGRVGQQGLPPRAESYPPNPIMSQLPLVPPPPRIEQPTVTINSIPPQPVQLQIPQPIIIPPNAANLQPENRASLGPISPLSPPPGSSVGAHPVVTSQATTSLQQQIDSQPGAPNQQNLALTLALLAAQNELATTAGQRLLAQAQPQGLAGSQQPLLVTDLQAPRAALITPDPAIQATVNQKLQSLVSQGVNIPFYPAPPHVTANSPQPQGDWIYQEALINVANRLYEWTQIFEGDASKQLTQADVNIIKGCLDIFSPLEPGLVSAINSGLLSVEGLYYTPNHRRSLAAHIIALNIQVFIYYPAYPGIDINVGKILSGITEQLYQIRISPFLID
jgi:hypothetical protein